MCNPAPYSVIEKCLRRYIVNSFFCRQPVDFFKFISTNMCSVAKFKTTPYTLVLRYLDFFQKSFIQKRIPNRTCIVVVWLC